MPRTSSGVIIFVRQSLPFSELSNFSLSFDPYSDYVAINVSLNNFSSLFLIFTLSPIRFSPMDGRTDSFSLSIFLSCKNLFILGDFNCHQPLWKSKSTSDPRGEEVFDWVISYDLLPLNDPDIPTLLHHSSDSLSSPDIFFASFFLALAPGRCFRDWVLITYQFFYLSLSLRSFIPTIVPLPSTFRNLASMTLLLTLTLTVLLQWNTRLFLFPLLLLSSLL